MTPYNASPESMAAGLDLLVALPGASARSAVLGEMGEMGDEAPRLHELVGAYAAAKHLDLLVCVGGENARRIAVRRASWACPPIASSTWRAPSAPARGGEAPSGPADLVLVKGSNAVGLDRFAEEVCADAR